MDEAREPAARGVDYCSPPEFTSSKQLRDHYRAVRARMKRAPMMPTVTLLPSRCAQNIASLANPSEPEDGLLKEILTLEPHTIEPIRRSEIFKAVSVASKISITELRSHLRARPLVNARFVYYVLARRYSGASLPQIGETAGNRDHTTVLHGLRMGAQRFVELYPIYREACFILDVPVPDVTEFLEVSK